MSLATDNGSVAVREAGGRGWCASCARQAADGELAVVHVYAAEQDHHAEAFMCGTCVAAALAVRLGASHLAQTGELIDPGVRPHGGP